MAFDPTKFGATPVNQSSGFDPSKFGATPFNAQPAKQSLSQRIWSDLSKRRSNVQDIYSGENQAAYQQKSKDFEAKTGQKTSPRFGSALDVVGQAAGFAADVGGEIASSVGGSLYKALGGNNPNSPLGTLSKDIRGSKVVQEGLGFLGEGVEKFEQWKNASPENENIARRIESIINIGALVPAAKGFEATLGGAIKTTERVTKSLAERSATKSLKSGFDDALDVIKPKLTPTEEAAAKAAGRGQSKGVFKKTELAPTSRELDMAQYAKEAGVSSGNAFDQNIKLMKEAQKTSAQSLREGLKESKAIWNQNEVKSTLSGIEKPLTIKSDAQLNKLADNFNRAVLKLAEESDKKAVGLLDMRQELDALIDAEFPANIYTKDTPIGQYVRKVRSSINDLTESKLPDGLLPNGQSFKGELRRQSLLYDAIENVAYKAPKVGESARPILTKARNFAKKHPWVTGGVAALGGERILKKLGVPVP